MVSIRSTLQISLIGLIATFFAAFHFQVLCFIFWYNPVINSLIFGCFLLSLVFPFWNLYLLQRDEDFLNVYIRQGIFPQDNLPPHSFLGPLLQQKKGRVFSLEEIQSIQSSIEDHFQERHTLTRYFVKVLVLLGLLGTFLGLIQIVNSISGTITGLHSTGDQALPQLLEGIRSPLSGMGVAFSSSILGLIGSLVLGFFDLLQGKAEKHLSSKLEIELFSKIRFPSSQENIVQSSGTAYVLALLEQIAEMLNVTSEKMNQTENQRLSFLSLLKNFTEIQQRQEALPNQLVRFMEAFQKNTETSKQDTIQSFDRLNDSLCQTLAQFSVKEEMQKIGEEIQKLQNTVREEYDKATLELKKEIRLVTRTLSLLAEPVQESDNNEDQGKDQLSVMASA